MKAVIVTGDRHAKWEAWTKLIERVLGDHDVSLLIHGGANGIDSIAAGIVNSYFGINGVVVPAQWKQHGKSAGPKRNAAMLSILLTLQEHGYTVGVMAFHDDIAGSKGTKQMVGIAKEAGVPVVLYRSDGTREVQA